MKKTIKVNTVFTLADIFEFFDNKFTGTESNQFNKKLRKYIKEECKTIKNVIGVSPVDEDCE